MDWKGVGEGCISRSQLKLKVVIATAYCITATYCGVHFTIDGMDWSTTFLGWWGKHHTLHAAACTRGRPLPTDRPYHWSTLESMDDDVVLLLFELWWTNARMSFLEWRTLQEQVPRLRQYYDMGQVRLDAFRKHATASLSRRGTHTPLADYGYFT
jgi:hypothetical protein